MKLQELFELFIKHNEENNIRHQFGDKNKLKGVIVFKQSSFDKNLSLKARSYIFSSDNKRFIQGMCGASIFGSSLDGSDQCVRLDYLLNEYEIEDCYLFDEEHKKLFFNEKDALEVAIADRDNGILSAVSKLKEQGFDCSYYYETMSHYSDPDIDVDGENINIKTRNELFENFGISKMMEKAYEKVWDNNKSLEEILESKSLEEPEEDIEL